MWLVGLITITLYPRTNNQSKSITNNINNYDYNQHASDKKPKEQVQYIIPEKRSRSEYKIWIRSLITSSRSEIWSDI